MYQIEIKTLIADQDLTYAEMCEALEYELLSWGNEHTYHGAGAVHVQKIAESMRDGGWNGPPVLVVDKGDHMMLFNGRHRTLAAAITGTPLHMLIVPCAEFWEMEDAGMDGEDMEREILSRHNA